MDNVVDSKYQCLINNGAMEGGLGQLFSPIPCPLVLLNKSKVILIKFRGGGGEWENTGESRARGKQICIYVGSRRFKNKNVISKTITINIS